jgi:glycyl-tRNA synthetase beta chain
MPRFVLEIGTEELPPRFFPVVLPQLKADGEEMLRRARLAFREVKVYGTPRRLAFVAEDLAERQAPHTREERGPSAKVAFDQEGKPTKAALGFARRLGVAPSALERRETDQREYVFAVVREPELPAKDALAPLLPGLITGLPFPKTMRWGTGKLRFGRPIRWLLALVDDEVVEFELEGIKSGRLTRGHPVLADGTYQVDSAESYEQRLDSLYVIVSAHERLLKIQAQLRQIANDEGAALQWATRPPWPSNNESLDVIAADAERSEIELRWSLLTPTVYLVEWPTAHIGQFQASFLDLPRPVLEGEMVDVQSLFPLAKLPPDDDQRKGITDLLEGIGLPDKHAELLPCFVGVRDGGEANIENVVASWERVLRAKLIDASYFCERDRQTPLAERVEALRGVVFHENLGTMYDKMERIRAIAAEAARQVGLPPERAKHLDRAAHLCKADLVTQIVAELPQLQGIMGGEYLRLAGEPQEVWEAVRDHYRPTHAGADLPTGDLGRLLAVADKLDTIIAYLAVGRLPSGSADPYGLRREATGLIRNLADLPYPSAGALPLADVSLTPLIRIAFENLPGDVRAALWESELVGQVLSFVGQRLEAYLRDYALRYDLVKAALAVGFDEITDAADRASALQSLTGAPGFLPTVIACTRPMNITKDFEGGEVDASLFVEAAERELWEAYCEVAEQADRVSLMELFRLIGERLRQPIDRYFDDVLVMHEDERLRRNRLAMCWQLSQLFRRIADFSLIVQT